MFLIQILSFRISLPICIEFRVVIPRRTLPYRPRRPM
jgi:hypothetical protein